MQITPYKDVPPVSFAQDVDEELRKLTAEMRIMSILNLLAADNRAPTEAEKADLRHMMLVLADLFSTSLPPIEENPVEMMPLAARDINLSRMLKERGLARLYRLVTLQTQAVDDLTNQTILLPLFMTMDNPETGVKFRSQEEFIGWFCQEARVPRSLVFMRIATYNRLLTVGMPLEEAFTVLLKKPYAAREAMNEVGTWRREELVDVNPEVAVRLARSMTPEFASQVEELAQAYDTAENEAEREEIKDEMLEAIKPAIKAMVKEVSGHQSMRDVMDMVRYDLAGRPEIKYWLDIDRGWIKVGYVVKSKDSRGNSYVSQDLVYNLIPEVPLPKEVLADLSKRLNFTNRDLDL